MTTPLDDLIARLEKAEGPDRSLDLEISFAINYRSAFDEVVLAVWSPMADDIEVFDAQGRRGFLDPAQFVPLWTRSIDAALPLMPEGLGWMVSNVPMADAEVYDERGKMIADAQAATPVLALLTAIFKALKALKARKTGAAA